MVKKQKEILAKADQLLKHDEKIDNEEKIEEKEPKNKKNKKFAHKKFSTNDILDQINFSFSRDAVWFKKTLETIDKIKLDLDEVKLIF